MRSGKDKARGRRQDGRAVAGGPWRRFRDAGGLGAALLALLLGAGVLLMDVWPIAPLPYRVGEYVAQDIRARIGFSVPSRKLTDEAITRARNNTPASFVPDSNLVARLGEELKALPKRLAPFTQPTTLPENLQKPFALSTPEALTAWRALAEPNRPEAATSLTRLMEQVQRIPLVRQKEKDEQKDKDKQAGRGAGRVLIGGERSTDDLVGLNEANRLERELHRAAEVIEPALRPGVESFLMGALLTRQQPLYAYDSNATQKDIDDSIHAIEANPPVDSYQAGDILVHCDPRGPVQLLEEGDVNLLKAEHERFQKDERRNHPVRFWLRIAGREAILLLIAILASGYVWRYRPEAFAQSGRGVILVALLLVLLGGAKLMCQVQGLDPLCVSLPILIAALVLCIAYDQRFALAMGSILSVLAAFVLRSDLLMLLVMTGGVTVAAILLHEVRTRTKVIVVSAAAGLAVALGALAMDMAQGEPLWPVAATDGACAAGFALLAGFLVQGVLPLIERAFGVATSMTLLEWCDADKPLLRRLRMEAPGTYSHCLQLGALCEAAAETVGARGLLARAGAYYHDVGKINKPDYFVENQPGPTSRHARLSPAMSLLIITGHVRDGLELAREYGVPSVLSEFIATHHGTTLAQYFYQAESDRRKAEENRAPEEVEFRYPGPKPRSREAAILMLADAVESSIRAMHEPTPGRIENQVHAMVFRRLMDGQLDNCDLTLRDVARIEESFVKSLTSMYHTRVAYPTPPGQEPSAAEAPAVPPPPKQAPPIPEAEKPG
jgi:putative nucleotidyltransferase with HDIG domain